MATGILITDKKAELWVRKSSLLLICDFGKSEDGFYLNAPACAIMPIETAVFGLRNQGNHLTSSLKKHAFYNLLINNILYLCVT